MRQSSTLTSRKWLYILFESFFLVIVYGLVSTITIDDEELNSSFYTIYLCIGLVLLSFLYIGAFPDLRWSKLEKSIGAFYIFVYVASMILAPLPTISWYVLLIVPYATFRMAGSLTFSLSNADIIKHSALLAFTVASFSYFYAFFQFDVFSFEYRNINAYALLLLLPAVLISEKRIIRIICIIITGLALLTSIKRGGVVAYIVALIVYIYCSFYKSKKKRGPFNLILFALALIIVFALFSYVDSLLGGIMYNRFTYESNTTDISSGRVDIYHQTIELVQSTDLWQLIWGHGFDAVRKYSGSAAHNDFLEVIFDFGIIGFVFYIVMIFRLVKETLNSIKRDPQLFASFAFLTVAFIVLSLLSTLIRISALTIPLCFTLGNMCAIYRRDNCQIK